MESSRALVIVAALVVPLFVALPVAAAPSAPVVSSINMSAVVLPTPGANTTVDVRITVRDANGWDDVASVSITVWTPLGAIHRNPIAGSFVSNNGLNEATFTAQFDMTFFDAPTTPASAYRVDAGAKDAGGRTSSIVGQVFSYEPLVAVTVGTLSLDFGSLLPGNKTAPAQMLVHNVGNVPLDVQTSGIDLTSDASVIPVGSLSFGMNPSPNATRTALSTAPALVADFNLMPGPDASEALYWVLTVPSSSTTYLPAGFYQGHIVIDGVEDDDYVPVTECNDALDNDGDGSVDYPADYGCASALAGSEIAASTPSCVGTDPVAHPLPEDPGFAYEDVDNNGRFSDEVDVRIGASELLDGAYLIDGARDTVGLVIPSSVGSISVAGAARFAAGGNATLHIGTAIQAPEGITLTGGKVSMSPNAGLDAPLGSIIAIAGSELVAQSAQLQAGDNILVSGEDTLYLARSTLAATNGELNVTGGADVDVRGTTLSDATGTVLSARGRLMARASDMTSGSLVTLTASDGIGVRCASISGGMVSAVTAQDIDASNATIHANAGAILFSSKSMIKLIDATAVATSGVAVDAGTEIHGLRVALDGGDASVGLTGGDMMDLRWSTIDGQGDHAWLAGTTMDLRATTVNIEAGRLDLQSGSDLLVHGGTVVALGGGATWNVGARFLGNSTAVRVQGALAVSASEVSAPSSTFESATRTAILTSSSASFNLDDSAVRAPTGIELLAEARGLTARSIDLRADSGRILVDAAGPANLSAASLLGRAAVAINTVGDIDVRLGSFESTGNQVRFDLGLPSATAYVEGATFADNNGRAKIGPSGVTIVGQPAAGGVN